MLLHCSAVACEGGTLSDRAVAWLSDYDSVCCCCCFVVVVVVVFVCLSHAVVCSVSVLCFDLINKMATMTRGRENLPSCRAMLSTCFLAAVVFVFLFVVFLFVCLFLFVVVFVVVFFFFSLLLLFFLILHCPLREIRVALSG